MVQTSEGRRWLDRAAAGIRSRPDREVVRAEVEAHREGKTADLVCLFPAVGRMTLLGRTDNNMVPNHFPGISDKGRKGAGPAPPALAEVLVAGQPGAAHGGPPVAAGHRYVPGG